MTSLANGNLIPRQLKTCSESKENQSISPKIGLIWTAMNFDTNFFTDKRNSYDETGFVGVTSAID